MGLWTHPIFHVSKLKLYIRLEELLREVEPPLLVLVGDTLEYEIQGILYIKAQVPDISIWCCGKGIHSPRLPRILNPT